MTAFVAPLAFALVLWWVATGVILYLDGLPPRTHRWTMLGASIVGVAGLATLVMTRDGSVSGSAYIAFAAALGVWAWVEVAFLLGYATGSRRSPCPAGASGWRRARYAFETIVHHEALLLAALVAVVAVAWGEPNPTGAWTFVALYVLRQSTKLNLFLGVRNLSEGFLPPKLRYLASYFRQRRMNALWPFSVLATCAAAWPIAAAAGGSGTPDGSHELVVALLLLGVVEHLMLVLPMSPERLWRWSVAAPSGPASP